MPDVSPTLDDLVAPGGSDRGLLNDDERAINDTSRLTYSDEEKRVLRQYEGAAEPTKMYCLKLQMRKNVWSYVLFHTKLTIQSASADTFAIHADAVSINQASDLRKRGEKNVLVHRAGVAVEPGVSRNYLQVEEMHPLIEQYRDLYCDDLKDQLGLEDRKLPVSLTWGVLLNPLFGLEETVVGSGLMSQTQYDSAKSSEFVCNKTVIYCQIDCN